MKTYESATLVELGNASDLVLGIDGDPLDSAPDNVLYQWTATFVDVDD